MAWLDPFSIDTSSCFPASYRWASTFGRFLSPGIRSTSQKEPHTSAFFALFTLLDRGFVPLSARLSDVVVCTLSLVSTVGFRVGGLDGPSWSRPIHSPTSGSRVLRIDGSQRFVRAPFVRLPTRTWRWRVRRAPPRTSRDLDEVPAAKPKTVQRRPDVPVFGSDRCFRSSFQTFGFRPVFFFRSALGRAGRSGIGPSATGLSADVPGQLGLSFPFRSGSKGKEKGKRIEKGNGQWHGRRTKPRHDRRNV